MTIRFAWVTDIPSPYRNHQFERMAAIFPRHGIEFRVLFMAWTEARRPWRFSKEDLHYPWALYRNPVPALQRRSVHVNPGLLADLVRSDWDVVMIGGWASPTPILAPFVIPGGVIKILGSESHAGSVRRSGFLPTLVKRTVVARYDAYLVPSERSLAYLHELHPEAREKPWVKLPNLVNGRLFRDRVDTLREGREALRARHGIEAGTQLWFCPARLAAEKGLREFLPLLSGVPGVTMFVAGDGPLRHELQQLIDDGDLPVRLLGQQPESAVLEYYAASDVFVLPSLSDPAPLSAVEATAARLPLLISSRAGNCADVVEDGSNGWVLDVSSGPARASLVRRVAGTSREELEAMGRRSLDRYNGLFDSDACVERLAEFIVQLAEGRRT